MSRWVINYSKIVGSGNGENWAQTHVFIPEEEKLYTSGSLLAVFSLKSLEDKVEIVSFGKETISRLHEIYYSSSIKNIYERLRSSLKDLENEFKERISLSMVAAIILYQRSGSVVGYFSQLGKGGAYLLREGKLFSLFEKEAEKTVFQTVFQTVSGFLNDGDKLLLGTEQFFSILSLGVVKAGLENSDPEELVESWAPIVHAQESNSQTAAIAAKISRIVKTDQIVDQRDKAVEEPLPEEQKAKSKIFAKKPMMKINLKNRFKAINTLKINIYQFWLNFRKEREFYLRDEDRKRRSQRTTFAVAVILIFLLLASVALGTKEKSRVRQKKAAEAILEQANYSLDQANSLLEINPLKSRSLLNEAAAIIETGRNNVTSESEKKKLDELLGQIKQKLTDLSKEYPVNEPPIFLDFNLVKEGFKAVSWGVTNLKQLIVMAGEPKSILAVELETKSAEVIGGGEKMAGAELIAAGNRRAFGIGAKTIWTLSVEEKKVIEEKKDEKWGEIKDAVGFGANLYLLDTASHNIWKYIGIDSGLSSQKAYLKEGDSRLQRAQAMAIDGAIWVMLEEGEIIRFLTGGAENFVITGLDRSLSGPTSIYTDEKIDNLYILDNKNTRVVVINKESGEYQAQYVWSGMSGASDLYVGPGEDKILLLTSQRIYEIEIKK